jgi:SAM-dependent methyltransferase
MATVSATASALPRAAPACVSCGSATRHLGPLPDSNLFAGRSLPDLLPGGHLYRCRNCQLGFRHPRLPKERLDALYAAGSEASWSWDAAARADWRLAAQALHDYAGRPARVLDIGCFDGAFLASLGPDVDKHGVEIMPAAAEIARGRGVNIVARDFEELASSSGRRYDAVTAFDVIEHVENPLAFLELVAGVVRPGGLVVVSTGNLDAWSWALMRSRYWYCAIPEHISFLSVRWFRHAARMHDLRIEHMARYAHSPASLKRKAYEAAANFAYLLAPGAIAALRRRGIGHVSQDLAPSLNGNYPPGWFTAADHVLVTLRTAGPPR